MKNCIVLLSLCLSLLLTACAATPKPVVLSDPEIIEVVTRVPVQVPARLLTECEVTALPEIGTQWTWYEILQLMKRKDAEQQTCNQRFGIIEEWQSSEL